MVLSYTPWESQVCPNLQDRKVLLVGDPKEKVLEVAAAYGLKKAIHYSDYAVQNPSVNPFRAAMESGTSHTAVANATKAPLGKKTQSQMTLAEAAEREAEDPFRCRARHVRPLSLVRGDTGLRRRAVLADAAEA